MTVQLFSTLNIYSGTENIYEAWFSHPGMLKSLLYDVVGICKIVAGSLVLAHSQFVCAFSALQPRNTNEVCATLQSGGGAAGWRNVCAEFP